MSRVAQLLSLAALALAGRDLGFHDDTDLTNFVTRPELKVPKLNVTYNVGSDVTPGLWFMGPYSSLIQERFASRYYQACSVGPAIYDGDGELVWSGACIVKNQNTVDFRPFTDAEGAGHLSMIFHGLHDTIDHQGTIMDSTYNLATARNVTPPLLESSFNMHEYKIIDQGRSALYITYDPQRVDITCMNITGWKAGWVSNVGIREVDLTTGQTTFEWWCLDHDRILPNETTVSVNFDLLKGPWPNSWNWFHPNSVDKSPEGDYLISGRYLDTIFKVSGKDGSILWRLGGRRSSFHMENFNFSKQHDAQFMGTDPRTGDEIISFFDNAKAVQVGQVNSTPTSNVSSGLIVALDKTTWTARVLHRVARPDGGLTGLRGNFQLLPNGNAIGGWSENGYVSEHAPDGRSLFEAQFASKRFVNYRAYKFNFTGHPLEPPVLKAFVYGEPDASTTVWYVSWNGATEVAQWRFCRGALGGDHVVPHVVGTAVKSGFETIYQSDGAEDAVYVEAIAANSSVIGRSDVQHAVLPFEWETGGSSPTTYTAHTGSAVHNEKTEL